MVEPGAAGREAGPRRRRLDGRVARGGFLLTHMYFRLGPRLVAERLRELTEVVAHRGERDGVREVRAVCGDGALHVAPEVHARAVEDAEREDYARERLHVVEYRAVPRLRPLGQVREAVERAAVVFGRAVDGVEDAAVTFDEARRVHAGDEVERALHVVARALF